MAAKRVGILGGGQLGRMLAASASLLNIPVVFLDVGPSAPAKQIVSPTSPDLTHIDGSFSDPAKIRELATKVDVITVEIEHVDVNALDDLKNVQIHPSPKTIRIIQDKFLQKEHLVKHGVPVSQFISIQSTIDSIQSAARELGLPLMLKSRTLAYDGRGNYVLRSSSPSDIQSALSFLGDRPLYAEKWVPFTKEIAVMVVRSVDSQTRSYPAVETIHKDNVCHSVFAPLRSVDPTLCTRAQSIAENAVKSFEGAGVFGVEMFLVDNHEVYINEIAPRPHNSGHYTIEACESSQYDNHLRSILGLPLGSTKMKVPSAAMVNLLGTSDSQVNGESIQEITTKALGIFGATVHWYGKEGCRKGRKMGHITVVAQSDEELFERLRPLLPAIEPVVRGKNHPHPLVGIIMGSDSDLPVMSAAAQILDKFGIPYELTIVSAHRTPDRLVQYAKSAASRGLRAIIAGAGGAAHLPGMVASMTSLPVIGVPVKGSSLDGVDSLYSIVQMPRGIPVATVAINNSTNAGLLAARIVLKDPAPMEAYLKGLEGEVGHKIDKLENLGWESYLSEMGKK